MYVCMIKYRLNLSFYSYHVFVVTPVMVVVSLPMSMSFIQSRRGSAAGGVTEGPSVVIQFRDDAVDSQGINIILLVFCMRYILHSIHYIDIFYY